MALLRARRSTRSFKPGSLDQPLIAKLAESVRHTPSGGNNHEIGVRFIQQPELLAALRGRILAYYTGMLRLVRIPPLRLVAYFMGNSKVKAALGDREFVEKIALMVKRIRDGRDLIFYGAPLVVVFHTERQLPTPREDAILAAHQMCLAAQTLGLGSCYVSLSQQVFESDTDLRVKAGMQKNSQVPIVLVIGKPHREYLRAVWRPAKNTVQD